MPDIQTPHEAAQEWLECKREIDAQGHPYCTEHHYGWLRDVGMCPTQERVAALIAGRDGRMSEHVSVELTQARDTIRRLNKRAQVAEAALNAMRPETKMRRGQRHDSISAELWARCEERHGSHASNDLAREHDRDTINRQAKTLDAIRALAREYGDSRLGKALAEILGKR